LVRIIVIGITVIGITIADISYQKTAPPGLAGLFLYNLVATL